MNIDVFLTGQGVNEEDVKDRTVVVIDVLRACSTIATALNNGARSFVPVRDMAQAGKIASNLERQSYLLAGERGGEKIEGYHLGNSPYEYSRQVVEGKTIIFNTTNGTVAIDTAREAEHLLIGSFLNAGRVVDFVREADIDLTIICAGWRNTVSLEDTLCAGLLLYRLWDGVEPKSATDTAHIAFTQYNNDQDNLANAIRQCNHAQRLTDLGHAKDVEYCLRIDALPVLPYYQDSRLVLYADERVPSLT